MKRQIIIFFIASLFFISNSNAQSNIGEFSGQVSFPVGGFKDFVGKPNWLGLNGQWRTYVSDSRFSVGGNLSWFYFQHKQGMQTKKFDNGSYTGNVNTCTNIFGLQAVAQYDFTDIEENTVPFMRMGFGAAYQNQLEDVGLYEIQNNGIQFMMNVDLGLRTRGFLIAATWHYLPAASGMVTTSFLGIKLGHTAFRW